MSDAKPDAKPSLAGWDTLRVKNLDAEIGFWTKMFYLKETARFVDGTITRVLMQETAPHPLRGGLLLESDSSREAPYKQGSIHTEEHGNSHIGIQVVDLQAEMKRAMEMDVYVRGPITFKATVHGVEYVAKYAFVITPNGYKLTIDECSPRNPILCGDNAPTMFLSHTVFRALDFDRAELTLKALGFFPALPVTFQNHKQTWYAGGGGPYMVELTANFGRTRPYDKGSDVFEERTYDSVGVAVPDLDAAVAKVKASNLGFVVGQKQTMKTVEGEVAFDFIYVTDVLESFRYRLITRHGRFADALGY